MKQETQWPCVYSDDWNRYSYFQCPSRVCLLRASVWFYAARRNDWNRDGDGEDARDGARDSDEPTQGTGRHLVSVPHGRHGYDRPPERIRDAVDRRAVDLQFGVVDGTRVVQSAYSQSVRRRWVWGPKDSRSTWRSADVAAKDRSRSWNSWSRDVDVWVDVLISKPDVKLLDSVSRPGSEVSIIGLETLDLNLGPGVDIFCQVSRTSLDTAAEISGLETTRDQLMKILVSMFRPQS